MDLPSSSESFAAMTPPTTSHSSLHDHHRPQLCVELSSSSPDHGINSNNCDESFSSSSSYGVNNKTLKWSPSNSSDGSIASSDNSSSYFTTSSSSRRKNNNTSTSTSSRRSRNRGSKNSKKGGHIRCCICQNMVDIRGFAKPQLRKPDGYAECRSCVWKGL